MLSINSVVAADIDRYNTLFFYGEFHRNPVLDVYGNGMEIFQGSLQTVQTKGGMKRIDFQQHEGLFILRKKIGMLL